MEKLKLNRLNDRKIILIEKIKNPEKIAMGLGLFLDYCPVRLAMEPDRIVKNALLLSRIKMCEDAYDRLYALLCQHESDIVYVLFFPSWVHYNLE